MLKPVHIAIKELGVSEIAGENHNKRILLYHSTVKGNFKDDETAWCSSFVNFCFKSVNDETRTHSAASQSWLTWGFGTNNPFFGDLVVFTNKQNHNFGHVGFYIDQTDDMVLVLGGNQSNKVGFTWYKKDGDRLKLNRFLTDNLH